jgi:hypothetical protein
LLQKPVDQGRLPMIDMGDDGDIAEVHLTQKAKNAGRCGPRLICRDI